MQPSISQDQSTSRKSEEGQSKSRKEREPSDWFTVMAEITNWDPETEGI